MTNEFLSDLPIVLLLVVYFNDAAGSELTPLDSRRRAHDHLIQSWCLKNSWMHLHYPVCRWQSLIRFFLCLRIVSVLVGLILVLPRHRFRRVHSLLSILICLRLRELQSRLD